jgi:RNA methyltransferase, TrmH family
VVALISSRANPAVKRWKALAAHSERMSSANHIWVEGEHLVQEARAAGAQVLETVVREDASGLAGANVYRVSRAVMAAITQLESPPSIAAVVAVPDTAMTPIQQDCLVLDTIQDPGNVGTMLRCAWAFGIKHVVMTPGCASPWSIKALRAGQGAQFRLTIHERATPAHIAELVQVPLLVTGLTHATSLSQADLRAPCAWVFGNEGQGASEAIRALSRATLRIDMPGGAESLNVAAACAICLYEQSRQRSARA